MRTATANTAPAPANAGSYKVVAVFGESAMAALQAAGTLGITLLVIGFLGTALGTVLALRRLATASSRRA